MADSEKAAPGAAESTTAESTTAETPPAGTPEAGTAEAGTADGRRQPPGARSPDEYTDPPGHHRRGPHGPALDVGA